MQLKELGFDVLESQTNFLFVKPPVISAGCLYKELYKRKILVRFFDQPRVDRYVRITIGTQEQMEILIKNIKELII